ncbi:MAG: DUF1851 domain-containing protein [Bacteroidetes bacterium]|nr:MAG: DUF1851 domain-containing protein [Bacteroidota bacterium]
MHPFEKFLENFTASENSQSIDDSLVQKYEGVFASRVGDGSEVLDLWSKVGFVPFNDGLFHLLNPELFDSNLKQSFGIAKDAVVFASTALGDCFFWHNKHVRFLDIQTGKTEIIATNIPMFLNQDIVEKEYYDYKFFGDVQRQGIQKLGKIKQGECLILEPVIPLGGERIVENMSKGERMPYLQILSELS